MLLAHAKVISLVVCTGGDLNSELRYPMSDAVCTYVTTRRDKATYVSTCHPVIFDTPVHTHVHPHGHIHTCTYVRIYTYVYTHVHEHPHTHIHTLVHDVSA